MLGGWFGGDAAVGRSKRDWSVREGERTRQRCGSQRFRDDSQDHGTLVDAELRASQVVVFVAEHVARLELAPLHLLQVETPYYRHVGGCSNVL